MQIKYIRTKIGSFLILILLLLLVALAYSFMRKSIQQQGQEKFKNQSQAIANAINIRFSRDTYLLYSLRGLYAASKSVERNEFKAFGDGSQLSKNFPGIYAIEFIENVPAGNKEAFSESVKNDTSIKSDGYSDFRIYPEGDRENYAVLKYFYPEEASAFSLGFDLLTEENRQAALEEAFQKDQPVVSKEVQLINGDKKAFVIFLPIYKNDLPLSTEAERRENLAGYVGVVIEVEKFFDSIIQGETVNWKDFDMYVYDQEHSSQLKSDDFIYDVDKEEAENDKAKWSYFEDVPLNVADRIWTLHFVANPDYGINNVEFAMMGILILFGVLLSFFISGTLYFLGTSRRRALILAESMTQDLRSSEEKFRSITEAAKDGIIMMDNNELIVLWNRAAEELFGYKKEEVLGKKLHSIIPFEKEHQTKKDNLFHFAQTGESPVLGKNLELVAKNKRGEKLEIELTVAKTLINGKWNAVGIVRNITERKKGENELKKHAQEMERLNKNMVGRELKMIELKKEIDQLKQQKNGGN